MNPLKNTVKRKNACPADECTKMCGIYALPSKTDFKARTERFEFEGTLVWKVSESENVLVLFCFCSIVTD